MRIFKNGQMVQRMTNGVRSDILIVRDDGTSSLPPDMFEDNNGNVYDCSDFVELENISDGYHTHEELYEFRLLYNALLFNAWAKSGDVEVYKSRRHHDGKFPFDDDGWFIVVAILPTGQISNHYRIENWDMLNIPSKDVASHEYDGHTPKDVINRMRDFAKGESDNG